MLDNLRLYNIAKKSAEKMYFSISGRPNFSGYYGHHVTLYSSFLNSIDNFLSDKWSNVDDSSGEIEKDIKIPLRIISGYKSSFIHIKGSISRSEATFDRELSLKESFEKYYGNELKLFEKGLKNNPESPSYWNEEIENLKKYAPKALEYLTNLYLERYPNNFVQNPDPLVSASKISNLLHSKIKVCDLSSNLDKFQQNILKSIDANSADNIAKELEKGLQNADYKITRPVFTGIVTDAVFSVIGDNPEAKIIELKIRNISKEFFNNIKSEQSRGL